MFGATKLGIFNKMLEHFAAGFVATEPGTPKHDLFLTLTRP